MSNKAFFIMLTILVISIGVAWWNIGAESQGHEMTTLSGHGIYATELVVITPLISGKPSETHYKVKSVDLNSYKSTTISVETTDGKTVFGTSYLIDGDTIYIKY